METTFTRQGILGLDVDVIVNPANGFLRHGAGLARIIADAAVGKVSTNARERLLARGIEPTPYSAAVAKWNADHRAAPTIPTGGAYATSAGVLPFKAVIHAVGPVWGGGQFHEDDLLVSAYSESLRLAEKLDADSIAFPAISCGLFGFPVERAAPLALAAVGLSHFKGRVVFSLPDEPNYRAFVNAGSSS